MLPLSQKEAIEDLALSTLHYLTAVNRMNSRKINQRNREIAHEFLHSLFQFRFNVAELLKHDLSLLLFCVENTIIFKNDDAFNSDDVLFMVNLLIGMLINAISIFFFFFCIFCLFNCLIIYSVPHRNNKRFI